MPIDFFYFKIKLNLINITIKVLKNKKNTRHIKIKGIIKVINNFYIKLYNLKLFNKKILK